jgi:DNA-dependent RNA polymerase
MAPATVFSRLALISRDRDAGERVNLVDCDRPRDVYGEIALRVKMAIEVDANKYAADWRKRFDAIEGRQLLKSLRKAVKRWPAIMQSSGAASLMQLSRGNGESCLSRDPPGCR